MSESEFDIVAITETWLTCNVLLNMSYFKMSAMFFVKVVTFS